MLDYDNNAFYYFSLTLLVLYLIPAVFYILSELFKAFLLPTPAENKPRTEDEKKKYAKILKETTGLARLKKTAFLVNLGLVCLAVPLFFCLINMVKSDGEVNSFDPYDILGITTDTSDGDIRKAFRRMSLKYHPDKNPGNKLAEEMFVKIAKAYAALTDEASKENYKRYGNPDGKQALEVSIGLPKWVLENPKIVLILYLVGMVVVIPVAVGLWYSNSKQFGDKNIMYATYQVFYQNLEQSTRFIHLPELIASSAEFRIINKPRTQEAAALGNLYKELRAAKLFNSSKDQQLRYIDHPGILKGNMMLFAHGLGRMENMSPKLKNDLDMMLNKFPELIDGLLDISFNRKWLQTTLSILKFSQCMIQGLWHDSHFLCQLPHFYDESVKTLLSEHSQPLNNFTEFLRNPDSFKWVLSKLSPKDREEVLKVCKLIPCVKIDTQLIVEEEEGDEVTDTHGKIIYQEDVVTLKITMTRENVTKGAETHPVLAPKFPRLVREAWWVILTEKERGHSGHPKRKGAEPAILNMEKVTNQSKVVVHELRFPAPPTPGRYSMELHVLSDCYLGIDQTIPVDFEVRPKSELPAYKPHQEDLDLDNEPTFFEQVMAANVDDSSDDDDDDEEEDEKKPKVASKKASTAVIEELSDEDDE